jgi:Fur family ferric uptake transcriptional regulator
MTTAWSTLARDRLREAGQRIGAARATVIDYLDEQTCCLGAQEIRDGLDARVGLASVYRVIDALFEQGLVQRVDVGDGVARFEPVRDGLGHHHHLVCDGCGKVEAFEDPPLERAIEAVEQRTGYDVVAHDVMLRGACGDCR